MDELHSKVNKLDQVYCDLTRDNMSLSQQQRDLNGRLVREGVRLRNCTDQHNRLKSELDEQLS